MKTFTRKEAREFAHAGKVMNYLRENQSKVDTYLPLKDKLAQFEAHILLVENNARKKMGDTKQITVRKKEIKKNVAVFYKRVCAVSRAYLLDIQNTELEANFRVTQRTFEGTKDGNILPIVMSINKIIGEKLLPQPAFVSYGITVATLDEGIALAKAFDSSMVARSVAERQKSVSDKAMVGTLQKINADIEIIAMLMQHFKTTHLTFFNGFRSANKVDHFGIRHNVVKGTVTFRGEPLPKAVITCSKVTKQTTSDLLGQYTFPKLRAGLCEFTCSPPGHKHQSKIVKVLRGRAVEVDWEF